MSSTPARGMLAFPDLRSWDDLFQSAKRSPDKRGKEFPHIADMFGDSSIIGYCDLGHEFGAWEVIPHHPIVTWIIGNAKRVEGETIYFGVTMWSNGCALVTAEHMIAKGAYWLALVEASTLPTSQEILH